MSTFSPEVRENFYHLQKSLFSAHSLVFEDKEDEEDSSILPPGVDAKSPKTFLNTTEKVLSTQDALIQPEFCVQKFDVASKNVTELFLSRVKDLDKAIHRVLEESLSKAEVLKAPLLNTSVEKTLKCFRVYVEVFASKKEVAEFVQSRLEEVTRNFPKDIDSELKPTLEWNKRFKPVENTVTYGLAKRALRLIDHKEANEFPKIAHKLKVLSNKVLRFSYLKEEKEEPSASPSHSDLGYLPVVDCVPEHALEPLEWQAESEWSFEVIPRIQGAESVEMDKVFDYLYGPTTLRDELLNQIYPPLKNEELLDEDKFEEPEKILNKNFNSLRAQNGVMKLFEAKLGNISEEDLRLQITQNIILGDRFSEVTGCRLDDESSSEEETVKRICKATGPLINKVVEVYQNAFETLKVQNDM